ncbi:MAG: acyl-CoA thioesterase [Myxococcales bacterium]|nr:acyl-CoA thioesterase [Myxococcales bacterium]USN51729.1 MAG: acyl-CoA thioesterase [Myxococcales bacterium]
MFTCQHLVRFDDVDGAGIVYYPRFFHFCHKSFEDLFNQKAPLTYPDLINTRKIGFPTVHIEADYKKPFFYGDTITVKFAVELIKNSSLLTRYKFSNGHDLYFSALITIVCMDLTNKKSMPLPHDLKTFFEQFLIAASAS